MMMQRLSEKDFVTRNEFEDFKTMTLEKFKTTDEKLDNIAEIMISGFERLDEKFERMDERFVGIDGKFVGIYQRFEEIDKRFDRIEFRLDSHDERFIVIDEKLENITEIILDGFDRIYDKMGI